jgi:hypothetical protein
MPSLRRFIRVALGLVVMVHALAHAVLPLRGVAAWPPPTMSAVMSVAAYSVAIVALFAAGVGILGSRVLGRYMVPSLAIGMVSSVFALLLGQDSSGWWGVAIDIAIVVACGAALNHGILTTTRQTAQVRGWRLGRWLAESAACGLVAYVAVATALLPWHRTWGTTPHERWVDLPGDPIVRDQSCELMHAVAIDAPPDDVWPWVVQVGQDRAGFYSYDWLERLFLDDIRNVDQIRPEWQQRAVGDLVRAAQPDYLGGLFGTELGWVVTHVEPDRALVLKGWGAFVLQPTGDGRTRFLIRSTIGGPDTPVWGAGVTFALFELPHFIMERKMMLGIKERAERRRTAMK